MTDNRVTFDEKGMLDEIVTDGGAHLEALGGNRWFLSCQRADGSAVAAWFTGKVTMIEEREAPQCKGCCADIPANAPGDGFYLKCPSCGWSARPSEQKS